MISLSYYTLGLVSQWYKEEGPWSMMIDISEQKRKKMLQVIIIKACAN